MAAIDPSMLQRGAAPPAPPAAPAPVPPMVQPVDTGINPLIQVKSPAQLAAEDQAKAIEQSNAPGISGLAAWLSQRWEAAKRAKYQHDLDMLQDLRQRDGQYDPDERQMINDSGDTEIYMLLTATKCRAAAAWIKDVMLPADGKPWGISPTPIPDLPPDVAAGIEQSGQALFKQDLMQMIMSTGGQLPPPDVQQQMLTQMQEAIEQIKEQVMQHMREEAKRRGEKMEDKIEDQLVEGGFYKALEEVIDDFVTFPAGIMKGPVVRRRKRLTWQQTPEGTQAVVEEKLVPEFNRVSPFDLYPLPQTYDIQRGGFFEREKLSPEDLAAMIGVPGYSEQGVRAAIDSYAKGGLREWLPLDASRAIAEGRPHEYMQASDTIEAHTFWGKVPGTLLLEFGMTEQDIPDRSLSYEANVTQVGQYVVRAALNPHPTGGRPYGIASYERVPGQIWGKGIPRMIRDCQRMCNAAARAIARNMAIASGPQVAINDISRIPTGDNVEEMYPWKIWQFNQNKTGLSERPIDFFQPNLVVNELLAIYSYFSRLSDDYSGIIPSAYGSDNAAGAGKTASGQAMLLTNASKVLSGVIGNLDRGIIEPTVSNQFVHNMLFDDDESIKGDLFVVAKGSEALVIKEQAQLRRNEFLGMTANPIDMQILGLEGRRKVLYEVAKTLQMDKAIVPTEQEMLDAAQQMAMAAANQNTMAGGSPPKEMQQNPKPPEKKE